jgi:putative membrane protein
MLRPILHFAVTTLTVYLLANIPGFNFQVNSLSNAFWFILLLTILNSTVVALVKFITIPINFVTLGIFHGLLNLSVIALVIDWIDGVDLVGSSFDKFIALCILSAVLSVAQGVVSKVTK